MTEQCWRQKWSSVQDSFDEHLSAGNTEMAWALLSLVAEHCLGGGENSSQGRHNVCAPVVETQLTSCKAPSLQSIVERRLRRLAQRVSEFALQPHNLNLSDNIHHNIRDLAKTVPELSNSDYGCESAVSKNSTPRISRQHWLPLLALPIERYHRRRSSQTC